MAPTSDKLHDEEEDEEDEDYNPEEEKEMDVDDEENNANADSNENVSPTSNLSESKRKKVDEVFEELFGYSWGNRPLPKRRKMASQKLSKQEELLIDLYGPTVATQILSTMSSVTKFEIRRAPLPSKTVTHVTEIKKFAGQTITVQKKVESRQNETTKQQITRAEQSMKATKPKGLDNLLQELNGPGKLTTIAKTSSDWDTFKTDTGMEEHLEKQAQSKHAYLVKKDFLNRVDGRRFEQERKQRDIERAKRGK